MPEEPSRNATRWSVLARLHGTTADGESWNWFVQRYRGYVAAILRRVGLQASEADAAVDAFWGYLFQSRAVERADRDGRFRSFLSGIVRNYAQSWRRERRSPVLTIDPVDLATLADERDANDLMIWSEQIVQLGLGRLAEQHPDDAHALRWFYGIAEGVGAAAQPPLRATTIAERLGVQANAMHQRLNRARERLRECLDAEVGTTVGSSHDLRDELRLLLEAVERLHPGLVPESLGG